MKNILIVGCGLIGSSLVRAIKSRNLSKNIYIYEKSKKNILTTKRLKLGCKNLEISKNYIKFDFIVLCTPMSQYESVIKKIEKFIDQKTIITDVGSTKVESIKKLKKILTYKRNLIPAHPIAGSEVSGPQYGNKNLFKGRWNIIIKEKGVNTNALRKIKAFWNKLGSKVIFMDANKHDIIFSVTSHLPHLIAYNLVKTATNFEKSNKKKLIEYSAGGLRDFTRIASSNEIMWRDIFFSNKLNMINVINLFIKNLELFKKLIKTNQNSRLVRFLTESKKVRKKIIKLKQDIDKPDFGR
ncbi:MAG: prephenate dehydrogenase/arogenate dehydrogenase family protein [Pelagibacteraceae bacterium TMED246]|nr:MAG: prephenate dehydrogenase/arogenate dehydrogenase family protein [Pelagibacteraceae bacterium TMED246]